MELSFQGVDAARASQMAREFETSLRKAGVPAEALKISRASEEAMGFQVLGIDPEMMRMAIEAVSPVIGATFHAAAAQILCKCVIDFLSRNKGAQIQIKTRLGMLVVPAGMSTEKIKEAIAKVDELQQPKEQSKKTPQKSKSSKAKR